MKTITTKIRTAISWLVCIVFVFVATSQVSAQPVCSNVANNNGNGKVTFNFRNNNTYDVIITDISSVCSATALTATEAWYRPSALSFGSAAAFPALNTTNWTQFGGATISGIASGTSTTPQSFFNGGLNLLIPAGATYGICINSAQAAIPTSGNLRYSSLTAGLSYITSSGGCDLLSGGLSTANASAAGAPRLSSATFANVPRGFVGCITFIPAIPCSGQPNAGTISAPASVCPSTNFTITSSGLTSGTGVTYTWQSAPTCSGPWTNVSGATASSLTTTITTPTSFRVVTTCSNSGLDNTSNCVSLTVNSFLGCYCASGATTNFDESISNVSIGTLNNSSVCGVAAPGPGSVANQYSNFTTSVSAPDLFQGASYSGSVTMTTCGGNYSNKSRMWIDFNQSGTYDASELVIDGPYVSGNNTATGTILVPPTAIVGLTGMRVVNVESSVVNACGTYAYGETEDYLVNIVQGNVCLGTPTPGNTIASASAVCTGSSVNLSLQNSPTTTGNSFQWQSGPTSSGPWTNIGTNSASLSVSPTADAWYQCVVSCSTSGQSGTSTPVQVTINPFYNCYCASGATSTADEEIFGVSFGSMANLSVCGSIAPGPGSTASGYSNYRTTVPAPVIFKGTTVPFSLTLGYCGSFAYSNVAKIYIDYNRNGSFLDAGEEVYAKPNATVALPSQVFSGNVLVPITAGTGLTGFRVVYNESSVVNSCGTFTWGETEDYLIELQDPPQCSGTPNPGNTLSSLPTVCSNSATNFTLSISNPPSTVGNSFTWQTAPTASGPWTNLGAGGTCNYIFRLTDTFGDGWNGAQMQVRQGTSVVTTLGSTFTSGTSIDVPVSLSSSTAFNLFWSVQGSWPDEVGIQVLNESGTVIYTYTAQPTNWPSFVNTQLFAWTTNSCGAAVQGPTYSASSTAAAWYQVVMTCTNSGQSATSVPVFVGSELCYCVSAATSTADDEIFNVTVGTLNNTSTCASVAPGFGSLQNRYSNYVGYATVPNLGQGTSVPFSVTVGQCSGFAYSGYVRIFIDANQNGDFGDAGELVYTSPLATFQVGGTILSGNIIIPNCATLGNTRMRVIAVESALPAATGCGTYSWGETEDYTVNIVYTAPIPPVATNINGPSSASCNSSLAYSVIPGYSGSIQWQFSTDQVNYTNINNATSPNQNLVASGPATFFLRVRFIGTGCTPDAFSNVITTVIGPPPITFTTSTPSTDICRGTSITLTANSVVAGPYAWSTTATTQSITVTPLVTTTYSISVGSGLCIGSNAVTVNIIGGPVATSALTPTGTSCPGTEINLTSQLINGVPGGTYLGASITHAPITISGTAGPTGDDVLGGPYAIPFNFTFYGNSYNNIYISTNGFVSFNAAAGSGCCSGQLLPNPTEPNNVIALAWDDLNNTTNGISYATVGTAPNRVFVVAFNNVPHFGGGGSNVTGQIHLYESTNVVEIHTTQMTNDGSNHTQGIENATGTLANAVPGRNSLTWSGALDAYRFTPDPGVTFNYVGPVTYSWSGSNGFTASTQNATDNPTATTTYTLTVADNLCSSSSTLTKNIFNPPSVFGFNGGPYCEGQNALFFGFGTAGSSGSTTCNYIFRLTDSYGDGWNNATIEVRQGATVVTTLGPTFTNGLSLDVPVTLAGNTPYSLFYVNGGIYPTEVGLQIIDQSNTTLYTLNAGAGTVGTTLYSWTTGACSGSGSSGSLTYAWSGPNGFTSADQNPLVSGLTATSAGQYTVTVTDQNNCTAQGFDFLTVNDNPDVDYTTFTNQTCPGYSDGTMEIGISGGDGSYSISDGGLFSTFGSPAQFSGVAPGTYFFSISDGNLCGTTTSITVGTEPNIPPVLSGTPSNISVNAAANACGANVTYSAPTATDNCPVGLGSVIQTAGLPTGALFPVGTTVNTFSVTDAEGATVTSSFSVSVSDINPPAITNVPANISSCNPVSWTVPTITDNCAGVITNSTHVPGTNFPSGTTTVTYTATDVYGNTSSASFNVTVLEPSTAASSVTSNRDFNNICSGENITLTVNGGSLGEQASWKWYRTACGGATNYVGQGTSVTVAPTVTTTYYVRAEGLCNTTVCQSITVTVSTGGPASAPTFSTLPTAAAPGVNSTVCVNPVPGATFYQWFTQNGHNTSILFNGQVGPIQTNTNCVNVSFVLPQQNYFIRVFAGNACGRTSQTNAAGIRGTVPASTCINGPTQVCPGQTLSYTACAIPSQTSVSYDWQIIPAVPGTATISFNGTNATVNYLPGFTSAQICVNGISTFGLAGPSYCINVSTNAPTPGAITGLAEPCEGSTQTYSIAAVPNATSYTWSSNIAGAVVVGNGTSATVTFPANAFNGNVCVVANSSCGVSAPSCLAVTSGQPGVPGAISGPVSGICNASNVNYSLATSNANSYNWIVPAGVTISGPSNLNAVNLNFGAGFTGGTITVEAFYDCGSATSSITVNGAPDAPSLTPAVICPEASELYTASSTGATSYNWVLSGDDYSACTNPPTCSQYFVIWSVSGGSLSVTASNSCGTSPATAISGSSCRTEVGGLDSKVYPNPTNGKLFVEFRAQVAGEHNIFVTDLSGRIVFTTAVDANVGANLQEIDLSGANAGLYMVHVKDPKGTISVNKVGME